MGFGLIQATVCEPGSKRLLVTVVLAIRISNCRHQQRGVSSALSALAGEARLYYIREGVRMLELETGLPTGGEGGCYRHFRSG